MPGGGLIADRLQADNKLSLEPNRLESGGYGLGSNAYSHRLSGPAWTSVIPARSEVLDRVNPSAGVVYRSFTRSSFRAQKAFVRCSTPKHYVARSRSADCAARIKNKNASSRGLSGVSTGLALELVLRTNACRYNRRSG